MTNKLVIDFSEISEFRNETSDRIAFYAKLGYYIFKNIPISNMDILIAQNQITSSLIGAAGETQVSDILSNYFTVETVSGQDKTGDLIVKRENINIMVEVKKYTRAVPSHEVEKFYRDLRTQSNIHGGVFISLQTSITGIENPIQLGEIQHTHTVPIIFVCSNDENIIRTAVEIIYANVIARTKMVSEYSELEKESFYGLGRVIWNFAKYFNKEQIKPEIITLLFIFTRSYIRKRKKNSSSNTKKIKYYFNKIN